MSIYEILASRGEVVPTGVITAMWKKMGYFGKRLGKTAIFLQFGARKMNLNLHLGRECIGFTRNQTRGAPGAHRVFDFSPLPRRDAAISSEAVASFGDVYQEADVN